MDLNEKIRVLCVKKKTTVAELSAMLGNSKQNLFNKLYRNDMKISDLEKIAAALDCRLEVKFVDCADGGALA